jgi:hypothetical protein
MGWTIPPGTPDVVLHYSEDPSLHTFDPHVPRSNPTVAAAVWTIDPAHAPLYWFPRDCPRVAVWANDGDQRERLRRTFATGSTRLHIVPRAWLDAIRECALFEYRFDPTSFEPWPDAEGQWVAYRRVTALSVDAVGDLLQRHAAAGIELRFVDDLLPLCRPLVSSDLPFSIVRFPTSDVDRK